MTPLTINELVAIERARVAVQRIVAEVPESLEGAHLVHSLCCLLQVFADERTGQLGAVGIAAAAIAELVERERGERSVVA